jgi:hypothetical protein
MFANKFNYLRNGSFSQMSQFTFLSQRSFGRQTRAALQKMRIELEEDARRTYEENKKAILEDIGKGNRQIAKSLDVRYDDEINTEVRVRFAPSPTGDLHIGGLRTALYNYLFAKANDGKFILRIEDTDKNREVEGSAKKIMEQLKWAGLECDEGAGSLWQGDSNSEKQSHMEGPHGPYYQSQRLHIYKKFCDTIVDSGDAYHCFCTTARLKKMREEQGGAKHQRTKYDRFCHGLDAKEVE